MAATTSRPLQYARPRTVYDLANDLGAVQRMNDVITEFVERFDAFYGDHFGQSAGKEERSIDAARAYRRALSDAGLAGLDVSRELGGVGLDSATAASIQLALADRVPPEESIFGIGLNMAVPTILEFGSRELQQRVVPPSLRGDVIWCQLYSEPGAGSDLAGLTTKAERDGDEWVVTGQKVWTSGAQHADLGIMIARTAPDLTKHSGITMFVIDMHQPGVTVRPLVQMTGVAEFNEVFLDEARVPAENMVGELNGGWSLAVKLLAHERNSLGRSFTPATGRSKTGRQPLRHSQLCERAEQLGRKEDAVTRDLLAKVYIGEKLIEWNGERNLHPSIGKLWRTRQGRLAAQVAHLIGGPLATAWEDDDIDADYWVYHVLNCRGMSLGGGTDEIQRNTLGERALGLPREPSIDREVPFRDLPRN